MIRKILFFSFFFNIFIFIENIYSDDLKIFLNGNLSQEALFLDPKLNKIHPAIVYMHGGAVREKGNPVYKKGELFFDLEDKIKDFSSLGFVVISPLRNTPKGCCNGDEAIQEGIKLANESVNYLNSLKSVDPNKVCLIGFSEGALISLWTMVRENDFNKAIVMSPSSQCGNKRAGSANFCGKDLIKSGELEKISKKIILTLGDNEKPSHIKNIEGISNKLNQKINIFKGDHSSFVYPREDVNLLIKEHCA